MVQIGLIGLPQSGKTTFFNLLTGATLETGLTGGGEVHTGSAVVPDARLDYLSEVYSPRKPVYAQIQFKDIPGALSREGKAGLSARLLEEARGADALVMVLRAFQSSTVSAAVGEPDPFRDLMELESELLLADLGTVENRLERMNKAKKVPKEAVAQRELLEKIRASLEEGEPVGRLGLSPEERDLLGGQCFLSEMPVILAVNMDEDQLKGGEYPGRDKLAAHAAGSGLQLVEVCARAEMEINQLPVADREEFMADLGLTTSGIGRLARAAYDCLGLISFFIVGDDEVRAWTIRRGTTARKAAGKVHTDIERGFIRAEVFHYDDIKELGSAARVKEKGLFRLEGKEYPVKDGDIINFRFNI
jgi:GTP-binding protein YchF